MLSDKPDFTLQYQSGPYDATDVGVCAASIVAATACYMEHTGQEASRDVLQKTAFALEKKMLKNHAHALTTTSIQGGLIFYRKEFEFYKSVFALPAKIPNEFVKHMQAGAPQPEKMRNYSTARYIRRLVFAIMREDMEMFKETFDTTRVFPEYMPSMMRPSYIGLRTPRDGGNIYR
jgi:hypothetical protein